MEHQAEIPSVASLEFSDDILKIKAHLKPACRVELEIQANPKIIKEAHFKAVKQVGKEVTLAGFRKGKAPPQLIEKNYPHQIDSEWQRCIAHALFFHSLQLTKIPLLNNDPKLNYNVKSHSLAEGAYVILSFESEPMIPTINPKEITLKKIERPVVNEDKVKETVRQLQFFFADWKKLDRPIQEGDFVILDVHVIEQNPPQKLFNGVRFEVTDRSMAKWMKELIFGHSQGEIVEGISIPDQDASTQDQEELKPKKVRVTIREVEEAKLPELNSTFVHQLGTSSVEQLYQNVEQLLHQKADAHMQEKFREEVCDILLTKYPFDVPASIVDRELRFRMKQLLQDPEYLNHWNSLTPEAKKRALASIGEQSEKAVRMFYLCRKIVSDAKITVSPDDIRKTPDSPLAFLLGDRRDFHPQDNKEVHEAEAFSRLLLAKAEDFVISHAKVAE
jgi:trigger factor